jgi:hypothetical protein
VGVCLGNRFEQAQVSFGIARRSAERQSLAIWHPQRSVDPDLLWTAAILQRCFDTMAV